MGQRAGTATAEAAPRRRRGRWFRIACAGWLISTLGFFGLITWDPSVFFLLLMPALVLLPFWTALQIWAISVAAGRASRGAWYGAATAACVPIISVLAVLHGRDAGELVRFQLERAAYLAAIAAVRTGHPPPDTPYMHIDVGPPTFAYFNWGGMIWASSGVAYDETDEAGKPPAARSEEWRAHQGKSELSCDAEVRPLGGHFYMVHAGC